MKFKIHGHACLEVITADKSLICDPWLVGSAYWRSWWNYPPLKPDVINQISPDYIYITHLHWDHFHGPTLRKIGTDKTVIIPKIPELRLLNDLKKIGFKNIVEVEHGQKLELGDNFYLTSYQFGPIIADSVVIIEADNTVFFNSNDAKVMGWPLAQILQRHPRIDFVLRSHSSANSRACYEIIDEESSQIDDINKYSPEFAAFAKAVDAKYAIPFASNQCCLHPETIKFNIYNNYAHRVREYFCLNKIERPECIVMAPGDWWESETSFHLSDHSEWYNDDLGRIKQYQLEKSKTLDKIVDKEAKSKLNIKLAERYAEWIIKETPWFIRLFFKDHPITIIGESKAEVLGLHLDIYQGNFKIINEWNDDDNPVQIYINNSVLNDIWAKRHWNSVGVSKRLRIRVKRKNIKFYVVFNFLNNALETGSLQARYVFTRRYLAAWLKRWREIVLYINIIGAKLVGKNFSYEDYLPLKRREGSTKKDYQT
jgi:UDP-MurNAc hydroxylase